MFNLIGQIIKNTCGQSLHFARKIRIAIILLPAVVLTVPLAGGEPAAVDKSGKDDKKAKTEVKDTAKDPAPPERTVSGEMLKKLPRAKGLQSILPLLPGIVWDSRFGEPGIDGGAVRENRFLVDGADTTTLLSGEKGMGVHIDFIDTVEASPRGAGAAWGGYTGGAVNVVTRQGGNQFHGSVGLYYQGSALDGNLRPILRISEDENVPYGTVGAEYATYPEDTWSRFEPVITLGGYIIKDRLWFFGGFAPSFTSTERDGTVWPHQGGNIFRGDNHVSGSNVFTRKDKRYTGTLKLTGRLSDRLRFSAHGAVDYSRWKGELPSGSSAWDTEKDFAAHGFRFPRAAIGGNIELAVSDGFRVRADVGYFRHNQREFGVPKGPFKLHQTSNASIPGIPDHLVVYPSYFVGVRLPIFRRVDKNIETSFSTGLNLDWEFNLGGRHAVNAGFRVLRKGVDKNSGFIEDLYRFYWTRNYEYSNGTIEPTTYGYVEVRDPLGDRYDVQANGYVLYLQDTWTLGRFSLTLGLRAHREDIPSFTEGYDPLVRFGFGDTLAPRAAFNWSPLEDGSLRVFGSFGVYYDTAKLEWAESISGFQWVSHYYDIADWDWKTAYNDMDHPLEGGLAGGRYFESRTWSTPSFDNIQPDLKPTGKREFSLGVSKELGPNWTLSAAFLHNSLFDAIEDVEILESDGGVRYFLVNPGSSWVQRGYDELTARGLLPGAIEAAEAKRTYTEFTLRLDKKFDHRWLGGISYTWSRLHGNYDGLRPRVDNNGDIYPITNTHQDFDYWFLPFTQTGGTADGLLSLDRTHRVHVYGAYTFDFGLTLGFHGYGMSGTPLQTEFLLNGGDAFYPLGRGSEGRTPFLWQLDLYAEYTLRLSDRLSLQLNADISNITDNDMARRKYMRYNLDMIYISGGQILEGFDYTQLVAEKGAYLDPRYGMGYDYLDAIAARLGVKLMF